MEYIESSAGTDEKFTEEKLTALAIYEISKLLEYIRVLAGSGFSPLVVVYEDGSIEKGGKGYLLYSMIKLKELLQRYDLAKTEISELDRLIDEFEEKYTKAWRKGWSQYISQEDKDELSRIIARVDAVLSNELINRPFVELSFSGLLNYSQLLTKGISELFSSKEITEKFSDLIKNDINESIKALAYDIPTASAMIALRAVEGAIREIYKKLKGEECKKTWKDALNEVEEELRRRNLESKSLEGYLDHFRKVRNEAEHPDRIFSKKESEHILMHSAYAIEELYKIMDELS